MEKEQEIRKNFFGKIEQLKRTSLSIQRLPEKTKTEFMELAEKEFCNDYGMTIKWLLDFRKGLLENPNSQLQAQVDLLAEEISVLKKEEKEDKQPKGIKRADGQTR